MRHILKNVILTQKSIFSHRKGIKLPLGNVHHTEKFGRGGDLSKKYSDPLSLNMVLTYMYLAHGLYEVSEFQDI